MTPAGCSNTYYAVLLQSLRDVLVGLSVGYDHASLEVNQKLLMLRHSSRMRELNDSHPSPLRHGQRAEVHPTPARLTGQPSRQRRQIVTR